MIAHLVLFRLKPGVGRDDPRVAPLLALLAELPGKIPGIRVWRHGFNLTPDPQAWDYGLYAEFDDEVALHAYFAHPDHQPVVAGWAEIGELRFCDLSV